MGHSTHHASHASLCRHQGRPRWRTVAALAVATLALAPLTASPAQARVGVDDYPSRLKNVVQDGVADPWNFWNRECTSFVAWRLNNDKGVAFHNYFLGPRWSDAGYWAGVARGLGIQVNNAPTRGAVAWWPQNSPGSTPGHVAYVMAAGAGWVKIEEYNYATRGGYGQRTLFRGTSSYPEGFIHFKPLRFKALEKPSLEGVTQVGEALVADRGRWWPTTISPELSYAWFADGRRIPGVEGRRLRLSGELAGARITVRTVARGDDVKTGVAQSPRTPKVKRGLLELKREPVVRGTPEVGVPLTAATGRTRPAAAPALQWFVGGRPVPGATGETYTPRPEDLDKPITVRARQDLLGYKPLAAASAPSARVAPGTLTQTAPPTLPDDPRVGARLRAEPGGWPAGTSFSYQWRADGTAIPEATSRGFTPAVEQLGARLSVTVTATKDGYRTASATTRASTPVDLGTLVTQKAPTVTGTPKVGRELGLDLGRWSRTPTFGVQWMADGTDIPGATGRTFTPAASHVHTRISARITASRPGYRDVVAYASALTGTARGDVRRVTRPGIEGTAWTGQTLTSTLGEWSVEPDEVRYRWLADGMPITGETGRTLRLTRDLVGAEVVVEQRLTAAGYRPISSTSRPVVPTYGRLAWTTDPRVEGRPVVGRTLSLRRGEIDARGVRTTLRWLRDGEPVAGADEATYTLTPADVGHRISLRVRATATDWDRGEIVVPVRRAVLAKPSISARVSTERRRATLSIGVRTPGLRPTGTVTVLLDGTEKATRAVTGERSTVRLGRLSAGSHVVVVRYSGEGATKASERLRFRVGR
ncbi:CHAP domain-containing protein [Nocardioidaceae bacterium]|nr:CHAP domain-containing protein [Nocardioidaceae bacterium]